MKLTKADIVRKLIARNSFSKTQSQEITETLLAIIKSSLAAGEDLLISGFGRFCVKEKGQRLGRNPATESPMMLDARRVVTFRCSSKLWGAINGELADRLHILRRLCRPGYNRRNGHGSLLAMQAQNRV